MGRFKIRRHEDRIEGKEDQLHDCVKDFLRRKFAGAEAGEENPKSSYASLDVYVVGEDDRKIGAEVKPFLFMLGSEGEGAFGQALLRKKRRDVKKMYVAFPMSARQEDTTHLISPQAPQTIRETLRLLGEEENFGSIKDLNMRIYNRVYSEMGIGLLGIMGHVEGEIFQVDNVEELYPPSDDSM